MNITKEDIGDLNVLVKINVASDDYMPKVESTIKDYSKKVQIKGFRKGKVPPGVIKKMYGPEIVAEELNKLVNENLSNYLRDNNLQILGDPLPKSGGLTHIDVNNPRDEEFIYELGLQPEFSIPAVAEKAEVTKYAIQVDETLVQDEVERLRKRYGKMTNPEDIQDEDTLYVLLEELDENGNVKEDGIKNAPAMPLEVFKSETADRLKKLKKGESIDIDLFNVIERDNETIKNRFLNLEKGKVGDIGGQFRLTLKNVNRTEKADINQDFFNKIYGEGNVNSEEEFKTKIREELSEIMKTNADRKLNNDIVEKLINETAVPLPDDFLKRWLKRTNENLSDEEIENEYEPFVRNLKWSLIVNKVLADANINIERTDIEDRTKELIKMEYGLSGEDEGTQAYLGEFMTHLMKNEEHVKKVYENVRDQKIFEYLKENLTVKEEPVSYDEFIKKSN